LENNNGFKPIINNSINLDGTGLYNYSFVTHYSFDPIQGVCIKDQEGPYTSMSSCAKNNQNFDFISDNTFNFDNLQTETLKTQADYFITDFEYSQPINKEVNFYNSNLDSTATVLYRCNPATGNCSTDSKLSGTGYTSKDKCNANCGIKAITGDGAIYNPSVNFNLQFNQ